MRIILTKWAVAPIAGLSLLAASCGGGTEEPAEPGAHKPLVQSTTSIWADVTSNLACGGLANVESVMEPGTDPHGFEPSLADRARMEEAAMVVANGLGLEESLDDTLEAVEAAGTPVFRVGDHVDARDSADDGHEDEVEDHDGHGHGGVDPHIWFDPVLVTGVLDELARRLIDDAGLDPDAVDACRDAYRAELSALHSEIETILAEVPPGDRKLVTDHDALGYFADRYEFEVIGTVIPATSTMAETNPAALEELAETIEETGAKAVFAETGRSTDTVEALADRVGQVQMALLHTGSLGPPDSGADTYAGFMLTNARTIAAALTG